MMNNKTNGSSKEDPANKKKKRRELDEGDGFGDWGGYMAAKRAKLLNQFEKSEIEKVSNIFEGVAIHVDGLTRPPIDELKNLMAAHGGLFHMYQVSSTTHIIASNLPNVKIKHLGTTPVVKPSWITDSIDFGKLLDYRRYLLYSNQSKSQPKIDFPVINKPSISEDVSKKMESNVITEVKQEESSSVTQVKSNNSPSSNQVNRFPTKTASDPGFLEEFFNNSRLHLIATLGAEFKYLISQMRDTSDGKFPGLEKLLSVKVAKGNNPIPTTVVMHIDMDCFFVSVSLRNHPELKGKPVAITHGRSGQLTNVRAEQISAREHEFSLYSDRLPVGVISRVDQLDVQSSMSEIASCSYEARKFGIKNGTFLGQAIKMCPDLKTLPYDFEAIKRVSHDLYRTVASYTLDIEAVSCDEMYVDVTQILKTTGLTVEEWASHIRDEIMTITGCPCSTGFGENRLQARLATRKAKPGGQFYLEPIKVEDYMVELPLSDLPGVGGVTLNKLQKVGLYTCGDVQGASFTLLQTNIGQKQAKTLKEYSMGIDSKPLNFYHERKSISVDVNYGIRFQSINEFLAFMKNLSDEVYNRMNALSMTARCVTLKLLVRAPEAPTETAKFLGHGICNSVTKSMTSPFPLNNAKDILKKALVLFDKLDTTFAELRGIGIQLTRLEKSAPMKKTLTNFLEQRNENKPIVTNQDESMDVASEKKEPVVAINSVSIVKKEEISTASSSSSEQGRHRGSNFKTTEKSMAKSSKTLNEYFGKAENKTRLKQNTHNIDMDVLNQLPEDLKQEIIREYRLEEQISTSQNNGSGPEAPKVIETESSKKSPFRNLTWDQIKPIIKKWTASEDSPCDFDTEMIADHFKQMAIDRKIEVLMCVFNFLHRFFSGLNCTWHDAYFKMINITQQGMVARYGHTLLVKRRFDCCEI